MSGPAAFGRQTAAIENFVRQTPDWDGLERALFGSEGAPDPHRPDDRVKKFLAAIWRTPEGREFIEWLADLTVRSAPEPGGLTFEGQHIAHAKHETRWALGQAVFRALAEGDELINQTEPRR
ncbi:hypothetical protein [Mesorhizobium sp. Z1-4]|uniref:hypothetical protein n=1 Tax=Mesorhizobium sp. Z1-4 TaxID=2448478 RepID=UPI000FDA0AE5|nr:hypothetical protein [Mesorhizobium sp. Z1-4]